MEFLRKLFKKPLPPKPATGLAWVNELKGMDDISFIEHATHHLNTDFKNDLFKDKNCLQALFLTDEKIHITVERITAHYIHIDHIDIELDESIANAVFLYHRQIFLIYLGLVENLAQIKHQSLLDVLARALTNATQMIKWRYYNYQSAPANIWLQISRLYKIAEQHSLLDSTIQSYKDHAPTTLSTAYIQAYMLGSLESLSLKSQQIDLISKMLATWIAKTPIDSIYDEKKHHFYIDTDSNMPARRTTSDFKPADTYRYWCFDNFNSKVELCISLIELNISPKQQAMKEFIHDKHALATLEVLRTEWSSGEHKLQRRSEERNKTFKPATTAYGFDDTCYQIKQYENIQLQLGRKAYQGDKSFDERLATHYVTKGYSEPNIIYMDMGTGYSDIIDESSKGIRLHVKKHANEVKLGMIVGVSLKEQKHDTRIGIIRSIKPIAGNELHLGIKVLSKTAFCVEAKNMGINTIEPSAGTNNFNLHQANSASIFTCLFLPAEHGVSKHETLIFPKLQYNTNDMFKVNILGESIIVKLTDILEQDEGWIRVTYAQELVEPFTSLGR